MMNGNIFTDQIKNLDIVESNIDKSKKYIINLKEDLDIMSRQLNTLAEDSREEHLFGLYKTINTETLLRMINSHRDHTRKLITSISQISSIANENIVDINKMMRILLNLSQSIYSDIVSNNKTSEEIYKEIENSKSSFIKQNDQFNQLIESTIKRALNDKQKFINLEVKQKEIDNRIYKVENIQNTNTETMDYLKQITLESIAFYKYESKNNSDLKNNSSNLEETGLVQKKSKFVIAGFTLLIVINLALATFIYIKL